MPKILISGKNGLDTAKAIEAGHLFTTGSGEVCLRTDEACVILIDKDGDLSGYQCEPNGGFMTGSGPYTDLGPLTIEHE